MTEHKDGSGLQTTAAMCQHTAGGGGSFLPDNQPAHPNTKVQATVSAYTECALSSAPSKRVHLSQSSPERDGNGDRG